MAHSPLSAEWNLHWNHRRAAARKFYRRRTTTTACSCRIAGRCPTKTDTLIMDLQMGSPDLTRTGHSSFSQTAYGTLLTNPSFPSDGTLHSPRRSFNHEWDLPGIFRRKALRFCVASYGIFYGRQNMLSQVGSLTDNGAQQFGVTCATTFAFTCFGATTAPPTWPNIVPVAPVWWYPARIVHTRV